LDVGAATQSWTSTGPSVQDILGRDGDNPPTPFREQSYQYLGSDDLAGDRYICPDYATLEAELMRHMHQALNRYLATE